jgi:hypothetical protein
MVALCTFWGGAESAWASGKTAQVIVGFTGAPPSGFQNVLLNVQAVRINPHMNAGPGTGGWQIIPTPPGIGGGNQNAELQIDLNTSQDVPALFNMAKVRPGNYKLAQILLDPNSPGFLIPDCPQTPGGPEGCIRYPIVLTNGQVITTLISGVAPTNSTITPLVIQVQLMINQAPIVAGGAYQATLIPTQSATALGAVTGSIAATGSTSGATGKLVKLGVTAETIGTNTAITSALVNKSNHTYTLVLPAAPNFGTLYDLAVAGGGDSYSAARLPPVFPNVSNTNGPNFNVAGQVVGNITGSVSSGCPPQSGITGATLQLLIPPGDQKNPNTTIDCTDPTMAQQCITVASANTDNTGNFPLPGSLTVPPQFQNVPAPPSKPGWYAMEVTAPGFDPLFVKVKPTTGAGKSGGGTCEPPTATTFSKCDLTLTTAFITGTVPINTPFPGQTASVQVFAETHGTNNIQSSLPMPRVVKNPNTSATFTLNVPSTISNFDLFATTVNDTFQGVTDPYQGHSIVVMSGVTIPTPPMACSTTTANFDPSFPIDCVGHGSVIGTANNANLGASVALSKLDPMGIPVQITTTPILNQSSVSPTNDYAFCTPGDTYELQPVQLPAPVAGGIPAVVPSPALTGDPVTVTIPPAPLVNATTTPTASPTLSGSPTATPSAVPTFKITCPTTCTNTNPRGSCPGVCNNVIQPITVPSPPDIPTETATPAAAATP